MKRSDYKFVVLVYLMCVCVVAGLAFFLGDNITGYVVLDSSECDFNVSCGYSDWVSGMTYCLNETQIATDVCFDITNNSVTLDLQGFDINGTGAAVSVDAIIVDGYDNVAIQNGNIYDFDVGIFLNDSSFSVISDLMIYDNNAGIFLSNSNANDVYNVSLYNNSDGVNFVSSNGNSLTNVLSYSNTNNGVVVINSNNSVLFNLVLFDNNDSLVIINSVGGDLDEIRSYNNSNYGVYTNYVMSSSFSDIYSYNNLNDGVVLLNSRENSFSGVSIYNNSVGGLHLIYSDVNSFSDVLSYDNGLDGVLLYFSDENSFSDVSSYGNLRGFFMNLSDGNDFTNLFLLNNSLNSSVENGLSYNSFFYDVIGGGDNLIEWDLDGDLDFEDGLDFSSNIEFGVNYVSVNASGLPDDFNSTADITLDLFGSNITAPKPFVDGVFCGSDVCEIDSFVDSVISFEVPHFTNYSFGQSNCGDSYCSIGENCSVCVGDCGNCSGGHVISVAPDPVLPPVVIPYVAPAVDSGQTPLDDDDDDDEEGGGGFPWVWLFVGFGIFVMLGVFLIIGFLFLRNKGDDIVVTVQRPKSLANGIQGSANGNSGAFSLNDVKGSVVAKAVPVSANVVKKGSVGFSRDVSSIRNYVQTLSRDPKVRIKYLIDSGKKFAEGGDYRNAKQIYGFIFEEYRNLRRHDEKLYSEIVRFRMMIRG